MAKLKTPGNMFKQPVHNAMLNGLQNNILIKQCFITPFHGLGLNNLLPFDS